MNMILAVLAILVKILCEVCIICALKPALVGALPFLTNFGIGEIFAIVVIIRVMQGDFFFLKIEDVLEDEHRG